MPAALRSRPAEGPPLPKVGARQRATAFAVAAVLALITLVGLDTLENRRVETARAEARAAAIMGVAARHLEDKFSGTLSILHDLSWQLRDRGAGAETRSVLRRATFHAPAVDGAAIVADDGTIQEHVGQTVALGAIPRPGQGQALSWSGGMAGLPELAPALRHGVGSGLIAVSHRLFDTPGAEPRAVVLFLHVETLSHILSLSDIGTEGVVRVTATDGSELFRYPSVPSGAGTADGAGDGAEQAVVSRMRLKELPLTVSVTLKEQDYLREWRERVGKVGTTAFLIISLVAAMGIALTRRIGSQEAAEQALRASERRFSQALDQVRDAVWEWDPASDRIYLSSVWDRIVGEASEEPVTQRTFRSKIHPEDLPAVRAALEAHLKGKTPAFDTVYRMRHADGRWIWIQARGRAVRDAAGTVLRMVGTAGDVTERKRAAEKLAQSERRFRDIVDSMADWVWETDRDHRIVWMSESVERIFGLAPSWHIGKKWADLDIVATNPASEKAMRDAVADRAPYRDFEYARRTPAGVRWVQTSAVPRFDSAGLFCGYRGTGRDVTDLKRAQSLLRDAIESIPAGVLLFDADDRLVLASSRNADVIPGTEIFHRWGISFEEILREAISRDFLPEARFDPDRWIKARMDLHRKGCDSVLVHFRDRIIEIFERRTHDGGYLMLRFDVTERERLGERLRQAKDAAEAASRAKSQFLANMSHELRTPLNAIIGFSQLIESELLGPVGNQRYREYAADIRGSGEHLLTIIADILDLSRVEAGRMELEPVLTDIAELLRTGERWEEGRARLEGVELKVEVPDGGLQWLVDPTRLKQAIVNLVSNAVKFTPRGGTVSLRAVEEEDELIICVSDTGVGMTGTQVEQALQPFVQVQNALANKHAGTGLGLPLTKALVELHGGALQIDSSPGCGTSVVLRLPRLAAEQRPVRSVAAA